MNSADQAAYRKAPLHPTTITLSTTSTAAVTLTSNAKDTFYMFQADGGKVYYRFGSTTGMSAATTNGWHIPDGDAEEYVITRNRRYVRFIAASGTPKVRYGEVN